MIYVKPQWSHVRVVTPGDGVCAQIGTFRIDRQ
jgi:hypothetical protein